MLPHRVYRAFLVLFVLFYLSTVFPAEEEPRLTADQQRQFLLTAKVIKSRQMDQGVTRSYRLTLSDGTMQHEAHFQSINERRSRKELSRGVEINFVDSYLYNIAAYELARMLGLDDMVPVTVERKCNGKMGSLAWWLPTQMTEGERKKRNIRPPDIAAWNKSMYKVRVFTELIYDTDRSNPGNMLIGKNWELYMVDFTRAFRLYYDLPDSNNLVLCSRDLLEKLRALDASELEARTGKYLNELERKGIMQRRDKIVDFFEKRIAEKGEAAVLY